MHRRQYLGATGAVLAGFTGCAGSSDPQATTDATATRRGTTSGSQTTDDASVSVSFDALQPVVVELTAADRLGVRDFSKQYLFFDVEARGRAPALEQFEFTFDGTEYVPESDTARLWRIRENRPYTPERGSGWILLVLPETGDSTDAHLRWPGGEWRPETGLRERLGSEPPALSVSLSVPETTRDDDVSVSATVTNDGDVTGHFVAGVTRRGPNTPSFPVGALRVRVPAGTTHEGSITDEPIRIDEAEADDGYPDVTYNVRWTRGIEERRVRVVSP